jgi:hypothetical protein
MTHPQEKAKELVDRFTFTCRECDYEDNAKQCALIAVDEILNLMIKEFKWDVKHNGNIEYWQEVKIEIEEL